MSREVLYRSLDASGVPPIVASPSGGAPTCLTTRGEVDELVTQAYESISQLRSESQQADETISAQLDQTLESLTQQISLLGDRVTGQLTVGAVVETLAEAATYLNTLSAEIPATSHHRLVLVANDADGTINGVYQQNGTEVIRAAGFTEAGSLPSGFKFFADRENQQYTVLNDAAPVSAVNQAIASVSIGPWTRVEEIIANAPLRKVGPVLELLFNNSYLAVTDGHLTFSTNFLLRIESLETAQQQDHSSIISLQDRASAIEGRVGTVENASSNNTTAIGSANEQIEELQTFQTGTQTSLDTIGTDLSLAKSKVETLEGSQAAQDTELGRLSGQISELETDNTQLKTDVNELKIARPQHNSRITENSDNINALQGEVAAVKSKNTQQDTKISALESQASQLAGLQNQLTTNTNKVGEVEQLVADANTAIATHDTQLQDLGTQLDEKLGTSALAEAFQAYYASRVKSFLLTGGVTEQRADNDDGITYYFTTFTIATGFGDLNFRAVDLSDALAPYTRLGYSFTVQRVDVDSLKVMFQHNLTGFPDDKAVISVMAVPAVGN